MKALTVRQPWCWAIFNAGKNIENRSWSTKVRGRVAIHAALGSDWSEYDFAERFMRDRIDDFVIPPIGELDRGAIIGTVEIVDCVKESSSPWFMGEYGFVLRNAEPLAKPIPCKGRLGFWECEL